MTLPVPATSLVGREREIEQVGAILNWPEVALLTLTGPGGVGKTRLALEVARTYAPRFPDGVVFVPLAPLERPEQVLPAVARALGLQESGRAAAEVIGTHLAPRQMLLLIDNFEHVLAAAPELGEVLGRAPDVTLLVTSRERLHLYAEHEYPVPPLGLPGPGEPEGEAVRLFRERARAVRPISPGNDLSPGLMGDICRQLDGLPLAIELAAARTRVLGLGDLRERLGRRLALLTGGARDLPARQQTLRAAIDWSYGLLDAGEQRLLARLAVFVGGWTLDAAEAVCGAGGLDVLSGLASLVDKSLVQRDPGSAGTRYRLLETVREYALEQLQGHADEAQVRRAHVQYFLALSGQVDRLIRGLSREGPEALAAGIVRIGEEQPNILAALHHAAHTHDEAALGAFGVYLAPQAASILDAGAWTGSPLQLALAAVPAGSAAAGWLHYALAFLAYRRGQIGEARRHTEQSLGVFGALDDRQGLAYMRQMRGYLGLTFDAPAALRDLEQSLAWARAHSDCFLGSICLNVLASAALLGGQTNDRTLLDEALVWTRTDHNHIGRGWSEMVMAALELHGGGAAEAERLLRRVLDIGWVVNYTELLTGGLLGLAAVLATLGRPVPALTLWAAAVALGEARNNDAALVPALFAPWLGPLLARQHEPDLANAVRAGQAADPSALIQDLVQRGLGAHDPPAAPARPAGAFTLTPREREVLGLLAQGLSNKQIASRLGSGVYTVNDQVKAVFGKLGVNNRAAATRAALERGLG